MSSRAWEAAEMSGQTKRKWFSPIHGHRTTQTGIRRASDELKNAIDGNGLLILSIESVPREHWYTITVRQYRRNACLHIFLLSGSGARLYGRSYLSRHFYLHSKFQRFCWFASQIAVGQMPTAIHGIGMSVDTAAGFFVNVEYAVCSDAYEDKHPAHTAHEIRSSFCFCRRFFVPLSSLCAAIHRAHADHLEWYNCQYRS